MTNPPNLEARVTALETQMVQVAADAAAARHLAAANDHDFSTLSVKVDAHRAAISALGTQTAARFDRLETRFDRLETRFDRLEMRVDGVEAEMRAGFAVADENFRKVDAGFVEIRGKLDRTTASLQHIVRLLTPDDPAGATISATDQ